MNLHTPQSLVRGCTGLVHTVARAGKAFVGSHGLTASTDTRKLQSISSPRSPQTANVTRSVALAVIIVCCCDRGADMQSQHSLLRHYSYADWHERYPGAGFEATVIDLPSNFVDFLAEDGVMLDDCSTAVRRRPAHDLTGSGSLQLSCGRAQRR